PIPELGEQDSVALFAERAQAVRPDFRLNGDRSVVAEICRRVDGLPLAIELAAARVKILSPQALLARLDERLAVLTTGARDVPLRLRTLRDAIAWSHDLLGEEEQETFGALAVFAGSFTLEAAEEVCDAELDTVASLVENSLLRQAADRLRMLETIREYALEQLQASARREDLLRRHAEYFLAFAEHGDRQDPKALVPLIDRLDAEQANLRAALQGARELGDGVLELRLVVAISPLWSVRSMSE